MCIRDSSSTEYCFWVGMAGSRKGYGNVGRPETWRAEVCAVGVRDHRFQSWPETSKRRPGGAVRLDTCLVRDSGWQSVSRIAG
eukprot:5967747-Prymnesium_polylepis.1